MLSLFLLLISIFPYSLMADAFSLSETLTPQPVAVDRPLKLTVELTYPDGYHLEVNALTYALTQQMSPLPPAFSLLRNNIEDPVAGPPGTFKQRLTFWLQPQIIGKTFLLLHPSFIQGEDIATRHILYAKPIAIQVIDGQKVESPENWPTNILQPWTSPTPVEASPLLLHDEYREQHSAAHKHNIATFLREHSFPWIQLLIAIIAAIVMLLLTKTPAKEPEEDTSLPRWRRSPETTARVALNALKKRDAAKTMRPQPFYTALEAIIRRYLDSTAPEYHSSMTAEELSALFAEERSLQELLRVCSTAKFGPPVDSRETRRRAFELALSCVNTLQNTNAELTTEIAKDAE